MRACVRVPCVRACSMRACVRACVCAPCVRACVRACVGTYGNLWELRACVGTYRNLWEICACVVFLRSLFCTTLRFFAAFFALRCVFAQRFCALLCFFAAFLCCVTFQRCICATFPVPKHTFPEPKHLFFWATTCVCLSSYSVYVTPLRCSYWDIIISVGYVWLAFRLWNLLFLSIPSRLQTIQIENWSQKTNNKLNSNFNILFKTTIFIRINNSMSFKSNVIVLSLVFIQISKNIHNIHLFAGHELIRYYIDVLW